MYEIALDLFSEFEEGENPVFVCEDWQQLMDMINFFFDNGYDVLIRHKELGSEVVNKGAFIVSREIFNNPIWQDVQSFRIFFYILGQAVFSDEGVRKGNVHIKKGQYLRSFRNLQSDLEYIENRRIKQYSISTISRKVNSLVSQGRLKIEDTELGTLFTVVNYESYQLLSNYKGTELGTALEQSRNGVGTEQEQNRNNNKNVKNEKNVKEHIPYVEIVDYLNKKAGKKFKSTTNKTREQIKARWNEGHRLEDFKQV